MTLRDRRGRGRGGSDRNATTVGTMTFVNQKEKKKFSAPHSTAIDGENNVFVGKRRHNNMHMGRECTSSKKPNGARH